MERTSFAEMRCSLARALELIGDWWSPLIARDLFLGVSRFDDLVEDLGQVEAVTIEKEALDLKREVDERGKGRRVGFRGGADHTLASWPEEIRPARAAISM